jgi:hypothetical protein
VCGHGLHWVNGCDVRASPVFFVDN